MASRITSLLSTTDKKLRGCTTLHAHRSKFSCHSRSFKITPLCNFLIVFHGPVSSTQGAKSLREPTSTSTSTQVDVQVLVQV